MPHPAFYIKNDKWYIRIPFTEVLYIEAVKKYIRIVTQKRKFIIVGSIRDIDLQLPQSEFCRIHRSFIISLDSITAFNHEIVKLGTQELPVSRNYKNALFKRINLLRTKMDIPEKQTGNLSG